MKLKVGVWIWEPSVKLLQVQLKADLALRAINDKKILLFKFTLGASSDEKTLYYGRFVFSYLSFCVLLLFVQ